jgi:hypothetical protein
VNAKTLKKMLGNGDKNKRRRRKRAVATVFFRFSHRDKDGNTIKNKHQSSIIEVIKADILAKQKIMFEKMAEEDKTDPDERQPELGEYVDYHSSTYVPYFDKIPRDPIVDKDLDDDEFELINEEDALEMNPNEGDSLQPKPASSPESVRKDSVEVKPIILPKTENMDRFMPICADSSSIMSDTQIMLIARVLPPLFRMREWKKIY